MQLIFGKRFLKFFPALLSLSLDSSLFNYQERVNVTSKTPPIWLISPDPNSAHDRAVCEYARIGVRRDRARRYAADHACGDCIVDPDEAGEGTHDDGQLSADRSDGIQLNERDQPSDQHGVLQQGEAQSTKSFAVGYTAGGHDDQKRRQVADKHRQNMLKAKRDRLTKRNPPIWGICRSVV